jgi:ActR/RegA family two-component response regulator
MFAPGVVIYEKSRRWESILKRYFLGTQTQVRPCRLPAQMLQILGVMPGSVAVIDLGAGAEQGLRLIWQIGWRQPQSRVLVLAPATLVDLEWPAREFGAAAFLPYTTSYADLGQLCCQQLGNVVRTDDSVARNLEVEDALHP